MNPSSAASTAISIKPEPRRSPLPKRWHLSEDVQEDTSGDEDFPPVSQEEQSHSKRGKMVNWQTSMKSSHSDTFSQDSDLIKEVRTRYFSTHPWDWTQRNTNNLSDIFRGLAQRAGLLGECIFKMQDSWKGPDHLKCTNYVLLDLPKGLKFLRVVSAKESPKIMGLGGIHNWRPSGTSPVICIVCGAGKTNKMKGPSSTT